MVVVIRIVRNVGMSYVGKMIFLFIRNMVGLQGGLEVRMVLIKMDFRLILIIREGLIMILGIVILFLLRSWIGLSFAAVRMSMGAERIALGVRVWLGAPRLVG